MRFSASIFSQLLQPIDRRRFAQIAADHDGDRYDKSFKSWDHFLALCFVQLSGATSLRETVSRFNAQRRHHYHLGADKLARSTLSDANARRPWQVFAELFELVAQKAQSRLRREGKEMVRLIDSTPIPLSEACAWACSNGRIRGLKMHVVYDPHADRPTRVEVSPANVNDVNIGRKTALEAGATYVFDKGYCDFEWWEKIHATKAKFVTRPKAMSHFRTLRIRPPGQTQGDGFTVLEDAEVALQGKRAHRLGMPLRMVRVARDNGTAFDILSNDMESSAHDIALLYKTRWQIELLFRWIKQHLRLRGFLGRNENAVRVQAFAAMIAFLLLRIAAAAHRSILAPLRFAELVRDHLFVRTPLPCFDRPPDPNTALAQLELCYD